MSQMRIAKKRQSRVLWPVMGLFLAVALLALSAALHEVVLGILPAELRRLLNNMQMINRDLGINMGDLIVMGLLFVLMLSLVAAIVAMAAPKRSINVKDEDILKERQQMLRDQQRSEVLRRKIAQENRRQIREEAKKKGNL